MSELPNPRTLPPLDTETRALGRAFARALEDRARSAREAYRLAAKRWDAVRPHDSRAPWTRLPDPPTPDVAEVHADNYVHIVMRTDDLDRPDAGLDPEWVALCRAGRVYRAALWLSRAVQRYLLAEDAAPGGADLAAVVGHLHELATAAVWDGIPELPPAV